MSEIKFWEDLNEEEKKLYKHANYDAALQRYIDDGNFIMDGMRKEPSNYPFIKGIYTNSFTIDTSSNGPIIQFEDCYFLGNVCIGGSHGEAHRLIKFTRCVFEGELLFHNTRNGTTEVNLIDVAIKKKLSITSGNFSKFLSSFKFCPNVNIDSGSFKNFDLGYWGSKSEIENIFVQADKISGSFTFNKSVINRFHISGVNRNAELNLEGIEVNSLNIYRFRNENKFRVQNVVPYNMPDRDSELIIYDSHLGKSEFYEMDLNAFTDVVIHDSFLIDCLFVNIDWPRNINPTGGKFISDKDKAITDLSSFHKKKKENYRQLKYALSKQGDIVGEHYFHGLEMHAYNKTLKKSWKNSGTKAILYLSRLTSDFGQSLWKPFKSLIIINWLMFVIMIVGFSYNGFTISFNDFDRYTTVDAIAELLRLTNPLHRNDPEFTGGLLIIDIAIRVWSSYMIYNIVRATRRFLK